MQFPAPNRMSLLPRVLVTIGAIVTCGLSASAETRAPTPLVEVTIEQDGIRQQQGRVVLSDSEGGVLLEGRDGSLSILESSIVRGRRDVGPDFEPYTHDELGEVLLSELPDGFQIHTTPHYVVAYNTSRTYAQWTSSLLERLHRAFTGYWSGKKFDLHEPKFPLPVIIYASQAEYRAASRAELGAAATNVIGYYSLASNRVTMFDLTGSEELRAARNERASLKTINQMLAQPAAVPQVATIVHEATHQIAFNCGLQTRFADIPLWLVEGMAVYFEAPDLSSSRGWSGIGKVNYPRLETFRTHLPRWDRNAFRALLSTNTTLRDPRTALDAYADAWALNYYLIRYRPTECAEYLETQRNKQQLASNTPEERLTEFERHFGPVEKLEQEFLQRMSRLD